MNEQVDYLATVLGHVILNTGPVLITNEQWEEGLPEEAKGVMIESTQEGYLVFLADTTEVEENNEQTD